METGIHNTSEIGRLRKVMLHRPGQELENLMPEYLERLLFDDIPYLKEAQAEHDAFAQCLRDAGVEVVYLIDLVVNSRVFDLGYFYDGWKGASFIFERLVHDNNTNFESYWAANESSITTHYQKVIDYFENYGE